MDGNSPGDDERDGGRMGPHGPERDDHMTTHPRARRDGRCPLRLISLRWHHIPSWKIMEQPHRSPNTLCLSSLRESHSSNFKGGGGAAGLPRTVVDAALHVFTGKHGGALAESFLLKR